MISNGNGYASQGTNWSNRLVLRPALGPVPNYASTKSYPCRFLRHEYDFSESLRDDREKDKRWGRRLKVGLVTLAAALALLALVAVICASIYLAREWYSLFEVITFSQN